MSHMTNVMYDSCMTRMTNGAGFIIFPLVVHTMDLVVSAVGIMSVSARPPPSTTTEDPYAVMKVR
jgi:hypothetical protein